MSRTLTIPWDFTPRPYQEPFMRYLDGGGKRAFWCVHRRAGKDLTALNQTLKLALQRRGAYWHCLPTYRQARKAIWLGFRADGKRIIDSVFPRELVKRTNDTEMLIELQNGSTWQLVGSDTVDSLVGAGPVGVVFSEFALSKPSAWELVRPILRENNGWAAFITTPRGRNHAHKLFKMAQENPAWFCSSQDIYATGALDPRVLDEERAEGMPEPLVRQEYLVDWSAALVGSVYGDLLDKVGEPVAFEHASDEVFTSWDLGFTDSTAVWFWRRWAEGVELLDHVESHGKPLSFYVDEVERRPYQYLKHFLPHDARARTLATGTSIQDQLLARWGSGKVTVVPQLDLLDGIQAARWLLQKGVRFHARCAEGLEALRHYHYEYDEERKTYGAKPEHDWSSHTADAFRYLATVVKVSSSIRKPEEPPPPPRIKSLRDLTMDEVWEIAKPQGYTRV